jgi:glycosyltransferase involved in cell wall biosynthesis
MDLSIVIPSRNEEFLARTVQDILRTIEGETEVIVVLDGADSMYPLPQDKRVRVLAFEESIGQRAATNRAVEMSEAKYIMKVDAHCAFDKGFDSKMMAEMHDDWTMAPLMKNLHAFDWVCPDGHRRYQGPSGPCTECGKPTTKDVVWIAKKSPNSVSYCFDSTPHFQYFGEWNKRPEGQGEVTETMSLQGSCFMCTRDKYWELGLSDESFGSWGSQGIEVACKTWLSGGKVMVNHKTWYAHLFRTQGGDFSFPYKMSGNQVARAKAHAKDLFFNNKWPKAKKPLSWLVEHFWPVKGWTDEDLERLKRSESGEKEPTKGIIYYTDNELDLKLMKTVQDLIKASGLPIVSASLKKMDFGDKNIHFPSLKRGWETYTKQIIAALENSTTDVVFFCEHDVLYHPSHFLFTPPKRDTFYYNDNVWMLRASDGHALHYDVNQVSGLCVYRDIALEHFRERLEIIQRDGFSRDMGFEPMTHGRIHYKKTWPMATWKSDYPNVDVKHGKNGTGQRWTKEEFRNKKYTRNWIETEGYNIEGWNDLQAII